MWLAVRVACHAVVLLAVVTEAGAQFNLGVNHSKGGGARIPRKGVAASTGGTPHLCYDSAVAERLRSGESLTFVSAGMMRSSSTLLFNTLKTILKLQTIRPLNTTNFWHTPTKGYPNGDKATARYKLFKQHEFHKIVADEAARVYVSLREPSAAARSYLFMESHRNVGASLLRGQTDIVKQKMDLHTNEDISAAKHWIEYACPCCQFTFEMLADRRSTAQIIASLGLSGYVSEAAVVAEVTRLTENRLHNRPSSQLADQNPETADIVQKHVAGPIYQKHQQWSARHSLLPSQAASNKISSLQPGKE